MHYDFHIHSCLSPCAENEMTPNNICNMAKIKGLDVIAVTDHNSTRQLAACAQAAEQTGIALLSGMELQSQEEVHILGLFRRLEDALSMQPWIDAHMPVIPNRPEFFGEQLLLNASDEATGQEDRLLLVSLQAGLEEIAACIHAHHGAAVPAHIAERSYGLLGALGTVPVDLLYDALEIQDPAMIPAIRQQNPQIPEDTLWLCDSDAHRLVDIHEADYEISEAACRRLWERVP